MPDPHDPDPHAHAPHDPDAIFHQDGPIDPSFIADAIHTLMRALPIDAREPESVSRRRMQSALMALAATNPRDPIEVMLAVQAISAYHAASACWRIGMNVRHPRGDSIRHISAAATAARTFDSMLRAMERRQTKPLSVPVGRPASRTWPKARLAETLDSLAGRITQNDNEPSPQAGQPAEWTPDALTVTDQVREQDRIRAENEGLDIANTGGILPCGGIIMPEDPTPQQAAYIGRRLGLMYKREYAENLRQGKKVIPKLRPIRPGDFIP